MELIGPQHNLLHDLHQELIVLPPVQVQDQVIPRIHAQHHNQAHRHIDRRQDPVVVHRPCPQVDQCQDPHQALLEVEVEVDNPYLEMEE